MDILLVLHARAHTEPAALEPRYPVGCARVNSSDWCVGICGLKNGVPPLPYPTTVAQAQQWPAAATHLCKRWAKDGL